MFKKYFPSIFTLACLLITITTTVSACANIKEAINSASNKTSEVSSQTTSSKAPNGTYVGTLMGTTRTMTFSGDTITSYDDWSGKHIANYRYYISGVENGKPILYGQIDGKPITAQDADTIWMFDVATKQANYVKFKYIPEQDVVVLDLLTGVGDQTITVAFYK